MACANRHDLAFEFVLVAVCEGVCKAALDDDPGRGKRPSTYVVRKVRREPFHHRRDIGFDLRLSHWLRELWFRARGPLALGLDVAQIAEQLGVPLEQWLECRRACGERNRIRARQRVSSVYS